MAIGRGFQGIFSWNNVIHLWSRPPYATFPILRLGGGLWRRTLGRETLATCSRCPPLGRVLFLLEILTEEGFQGRFGMLQSEFVQLSPR